MPLTSSKLNNHEPRPQGGLFSRGGNVHTGFSALNNYNADFLSKRNREIKEQPVAWGTERKQYLNLHIPECPCTRARPNYLIFQDLRLSQSNLGPH